MRKYIIILLALLFVSLLFGAYVNGDLSVEKNVIWKGKAYAANGAVSDDDCTGEQGWFWYDSTDLAFEFCNANSGAPTEIGSGGGGSSRIELDPTLVHLPTATAAALQCVESSASAPKPRWCELLYTTGEYGMWTFRIPEDWATVTTPTCGVQYKMVSGTANNTEWTCQIACITPGDSQDADANAFATANVSADDTVPGTAGYIAEHTWNLTNDDSCAAGDFASIVIQRSTPTGTDATGEAELVWAFVEYTP
jgi:hypothetical protein